MIGRVDAIGLETAETDIPRGRGLPTDGDEEVENIETGETFPMTGQEGAARTLLTHGPVVEVKMAVPKPPADQLSM